MARFTLVLGFLTLLQGALSNAHAAAAVMVVDAFNKKIHVAADGNGRRPVGGLAKIVTAMVALDWAEASGVGVNVLATVPEYAPRIAGQRSLELYPGDRLTLRDLIYATMMESDDTAAITLGHFIGQDHLQRLGRGGDPLIEFTRQMNQLALREGCTGSRFTNPHGLENSRPAPYSTAADIARLSLYAAARPAMRFYTNQKQRNVTVYRGGGTVSVTLNNRNPLLGVDRVDGIKYAQTPLSGGCLVVTADRPASVYPQPDGSSVIYKHRLVVVVMGSGNPAGEARALLNQGWRVYEQWLSAGRPVTERNQLLPYY
ncbi:MAG: D-alanyl-D-alanine carboxypeptidase [Verrucomicrobiales bacterium]|nr:D-alanyl-D-alanine carboxypeptidase [Verrucomicrobiales bacterium]